jgi:hypothetical protein
VGTLNTAVKGIKLPLGLRCVYRLGACEMTVDSWGGGGGGGVCPEHVQVAGDLLPPRGRVKHFFSGLAEKLVASPAGSRCTWTIYFAVTTCRTPEFLLAVSSCLSIAVCLGCKLGNLNKVKISRMVT